MKQKNNTAAKNKNLVKSVLKKIDLNLNNLLGHFNLTHCVPNIFKIAILLFLFLVKYFNELWR